MQPLSWPCTGVTARCGLPQTASFSHPIYKRRSVFLLLCIISHFLWQHRPSRHHWLNLFGHFKINFFNIFSFRFQAIEGPGQMPSHVRGAYLTADLLRQVGLSSFQDASAYSSPALSGTIQSDERTQSLESKRHLSAWVSSVWDCEATSDCGSHDPLVKSHPTQSLTLSQFWGQSGLGLLHELIPEVARCACESLSAVEKKKNIYSACTHPVGKHKHHSACKLRQKGKYCHYHTIYHFVFVFLDN